MPAKVVLEIQTGNLAGQKFVFEERTMCIVGRAKDCEPRIIADANHKTISRHHCLLDINPPDIRVRNFGSLNGTYVNGEKIGQRQKDQCPNDAAAVLFPEYDLKDGDKIRLGSALIRVRVHVPAACSNCGAEIPDSQGENASSPPGTTLCQSCLEKIKREDVYKLARKTMAEEVRLCAKCGQNVVGETGANRQGEYICAACRDNPFKLMDQLLNQAKSGNKDLKAIEGYQYIKELGRGGMGAVYLARHEKTNRQVAIKVMLPKVAASPNATEKFLREIENTKALRHPNVVQVYDSGCSQGTFFFTLEFCDSGSADKLMKLSGGKLPIDIAAPIILQALDGLHYAHNAEIPCVKLKGGKIGRGRGLVHRDLKPQNIFLSGSGNAALAKIGDYGLAKAFDLAGLSGHTFTGEVFGTPMFMSRQQVLKYKEAKPEIDVWAMAATFYNMLTGQVPRNFSSKTDVWQTVLQTDPVPIRNRKSDIPPRLAEVIDHALIDKPEIGFKTAAEFKQALERAL